MVAQPEGTAVVPRRAGAGPQRPGRQPSVTRKRDRRQVPVPGRGPVAGPKALPSEPRETGLSTEGAPRAPAIQTPPDGDAGSVLLRCQSAFLAAPRPEKMAPTNRVAGDVASGSRNIRAPYRVLRPDTSRSSAQTAAEASAAKVKGAAAGVTP